MRTLTGSLASIHARGHHLSSLLAYRTCARYVALRGSRRLGITAPAKQTDKGFIYLKEDFQDWRSFNIAVWFPNHGGTKLQRYASGLHKKLDF